MQIEVKTLKCESPSNGDKDTKNGPLAKERHEQHEEELEDHVAASLGEFRRRIPRRHRYSRSESYRNHIEDRLKNLERKISVVSRKRASLEKKIAHASQEYLVKRVHTLERIQTDLVRQFSSHEDEESVENKNQSEAISRLGASIRKLEESSDANRTETKQELTELGINAARKAAELSLTREELASLRRTVQALSVSASKLQDKSDLQEDTIASLNSTIARLDISSALAKAENVTRELEEVEDQYRLIVDGLPGNCEDRDGLTLLAAGQGAPSLVSCHAGWIVIGRRIDGMLDFDRTWNEYSLGFGSPVNEFWIGNEALHRLTRDNCSKLRIDLLDIHGTSWRAEYEHFNVDSEETGYRLRVAGYSGNATDALSYQNGMSFSAKDRDMDISTTDCAANYHGGWWFSHCQHANLNGKYTLGLTWFRSDTNSWMAVASSEMSLRREEGCSR